MMLSKVSSVGSPGTRRSAYLPRSIEPGPHPDRDVRPCHRWRAATPAPGSCAGFSRTVRRLAMMRESCRRDRVPRDQTNTLVVHQGERFEDCLERSYVGISFRLAVRAEQGLFHRALRLSMGMLSNTSMPNPPGSPRRWPSNPIRGWRWWDRGPRPSAPSCRGSTGPVRLRESEPRKPLHRGEETKQCCACLHPRSRTQPRASATVDVRDFIETGIDHGIGSRKSGHMAGDPHAEGVCFAARRQSPIREFMPKLYGFTCG